MALNVQCAPHVHTARVMTVWVARVRAIVTVAGLWTRLPARHARPISMACHVRHVLRVVRTAAAMRAWAATGCARAARAGATRH